MAGDYAEAQVGDACLLERHANPSGDTFCTDCYMADKRLKGEHEVRILACVVWLALTNNDQHSNFSCGVMGEGLPQHISVSRMRSPAMVVTPF